MSDTPRVWVGCLGCYNAGHLIGEWFNATDAPTDIDAFNESDAKPGVESGAYREHFAMGHEELWVMDHEGFSGLLTGECSPKQAQAIAEVIASVPDYIEVEAVAAYVSNYGVNVAELDISEFEDSFAGKWSDREEYAENLAEDIGAIDQDATWPNSYIDWERAARDLFMGDYWDAPAPDGGIYVFRSY